MAGAQRRRQTDLGHLQPCKSGSLQSHGGADDNRAAGQRSFDERRSGMITLINLGEIQPLHDTVKLRQAALKGLVDDMKGNGWQGRPLLVIERESGYLA